MTSHQVRFSIIIPTRGRVEQLQDCLEALCALDYPTNLFEVIVVDDGGELSQNELRERFGGRLALRCTRQPPRGPAEARNVGARLADFDTLAFTDDDCRPAPDWLNVLAAQLGERPNGAVAGRVTNAIADSLLLGSEHSTGRFCRRPRQRRHARRPLRHVEQPRGRGRTLHAAGWVRPTVHSCRR